MGDTNLNALAAAAKLKLQAQQKDQEGSKQEAPVDIYADMKNELEEDERGLAPQQKTTQYNFTNPLAGEEADEEEYVIRENEELVFENGPSVSQVELWKKKYGDGRVLHTKIIDRHFVFRTLYRFEYKQIVAIDNIEALHREESICRTVTLWPSQYDFKKMAADDGGYPSTLAQIIMESSGFTKEYAIEVL